MSVLGTGTRNHVAKRAIRRARFTTVLGGLILAVGACGGGANTAAFCETTKQAQRSFDELASKATSQKTDVTVDSGVSRADVELRGHLHQYVEELQSTAPSEVRNQMNRIADNFTTTQPGHPPRLVITGGSDVELAVEQVDDFANEVCGQTALATRLAGDDSATSQGEEHVSGGSDDHQQEPRPQEDRLPDADIAHTKAFDLTHREGYTFSGQLSFALYNAEAEIKNAPPGEADLYAGMFLDVVVENTTEGRRAPLKHPAVYVYFNDQLVRIAAPLEPWGDAGEQVPRYKLEPGQRGSLAGLDKRVEIGRFDQEEAESLAELLNDGAIDGFEVILFTGRVTLADGDLYGADGSSIGPSERTHATILDLEPGSTQGCESTDPTMNGFCPSAF